MHDQLPPPPPKKYYFASVRGLASNRSERPYLAARTLLLADPATSVVIFIKYRKGFHLYGIAKFCRLLKRQRYIRVLATIIRRGVRL